MKRQVVKDEKINGSLEVHSSQYESTAIPSSWKIARFDDVATVTDYVANGSFASLRENVKYRDEPDYAILVRFTDYVKNWKRNFVYVNKDAYDFLMKSTLQPGDVVIANVGDPGRVFRVPNLGRPMTLGPNSVLVRGRNGVENGFIFYFFMSPWGQDLIASITTGTAQKKFNKTGLRATYIPTAPQDKQKVIVAEIEKQFSRLDEAVANLNRVKANLKRYKAAVLKAAVEGRLVETEAELARREGRSYETGSQHLKRSLDTRRRRWNGNGKYKEPVTTNTADLPELPEGWVWASAVQACEPVIDCHNKTAPYTDSGIPLVRTSNIRNGRLLLEDVRYVNQATYDFWSRRCPPVPGDVLFTREAPMGEAAIIPPGTKLCMGQRMMLMRPSSAITAQFLLCALMSPVINRMIERIAVGTGVKHLRVGDVELLPIPIPPRLEQDRIVSEVDRRFSLCREVEAQVDANIQRAERLRQAVLKKAFTGALTVSGRSI